MKKIFLLVFFMFLTPVVAISCGGSGTGSNNADEDMGGDDDGGDDGSDGATDSSSGGSWSAGGEALTIDDVVNGSGSGASLTKAVTASSDAAFYFGRFIFDDGADLHCGSIKFKLNKENSNSAYFSDVSLENMSTVVNGTSSTPTVTSSTDLDVDPNYSASSNRVEIADATSRFVAFDLDFGNNDYFGDVTDAGVIFSSDFLTMAGGNDVDFFFIAQKVDSQPDVVDDDIVDDWDDIRFNVDTSSGEILLAATGEVTVSGADSDGHHAFEGTDTLYGSIEGSAGLTDEKGGCFAYTFDEVYIYGGFVLSADTLLGAGYDIDTATYFVMEKVE
ncbi:MAG: hypothetical protein HY541_02395 [Deltaproteobacteria bacterium]|nr:hypothetical protein [Deltaproteobacteria bacterium]